MTHEAPRDNLHNAATHSPASLTTDYTRYYSRISPLLQQGRLHFQKIAERAGFKERKVREVLLFRLMPGNTIQLFGKKEGLCFICSAKSQETSLPEPLCLTCLGMIAHVIEELYPLSVAETIAITPDTPHITEKAALEAIEAMVPLQQYETVLQEVHQYREKYGALEPDTSAFTPQPIVPDQLTKSHLQNPATVFIEHKTDDSPLEKVTCSDSPNDVMRLLHSNDLEEDETTVFSSPSSETIRHFGFQRAKPRR